MSLLELLLDDDDFMETVRDTFSTRTSRIWTDRAEDLSDFVWREYGLDTEVDPSARTVFIRDSRVPNKFMAIHGEGRGKYDPVVSYTNSAFTVEVAYAMEGGGEKSPSGD